MNDTSNAKDEMEQRRRAQSSDHSLCSDTKMIQDQGVNAVAHRITSGMSRGGEYPRMNYNDVMTY